MAILNLEHLDPMPEDPPPTYGAPGIRIIAATFGGVIVTDKIRDLVTEDETMTIDLGKNKMVRYLAPDPLPGKPKTLTVLYELPGVNDNKGGNDDDTSAAAAPVLYLLNAPESPNRGPIQISRTGSASATVERLDQETSVFRRATLPDVEIVAAVYGLKRVRTESVLLALARFFSEMDEQGAIRMTNHFWQEDTWHGKFKSWTIYFRFRGSNRIQCVTGLEGQALEVPWCRHV
jgi:hypothetical protein